MGTNGRIGRDSARVRTAADADPGGEFAAEAAAVTLDADAAAMNRRALLRRGAAGVAVAGTAWAAPAILRSDALGACPPGSPCTPTSRLDWSAQAVCASPGSVTVGGITVLITPSGTGAGDCFQVRKSTGDSCDPGGLVANFPRGLPSTGSPGPAFNQADDDFYSLYKNASGSAVGVTFSFTSGGSPVGVSGLTFAIGDIDTNTLLTRYTDLVTLTAVDGNGSTMDAAAVAAAITVTKGSSPPSGGNPFTGTGALVSTSAATVVVAFTCVVRSVTVSFANSISNPSGPQWIAISDLLWCP